MSSLSDVALRARQVRLIAGREVNARIRTRAYQLSTLAVMLLTAGGLLGSQLLPDAFEPEPLRLGLVPSTTAQEESLLAAADVFERDLELLAYDDPPAAQAALDEGDIDAVLTAPGEVAVESNLNNTLEAIVRQALAVSQLADRADELGLTLEEAQSLLAPPAVEVSATDPNPDEVDAAVGQGVGAASAIALLMAISFYGQWVLVGVIEEKSNRVVEVLLASVATWELLVGKVLGILALAVAQLGAGLAVLGITFIALEGTEAIPSVALAGVSMAALWLVIGLLLYNFLYAAVGATVNRPEDATSVTFPLMIPLFGGYFVGLIAIPQSPDSILARALSLFPLTSPLTMPSRIASGGGSPIEVVLAVVLALGALVGIVWLAGRIYSGGILQSSRVSFIDAFRRSRDMR